MRACNEKHMMVTAEVVEGSELEGVAGLDRGDITGRESESIAIERASKMSN